MLAGLDDSAGARVSRLRAVASVGCRMPVMGKPEEVVCDCEACGLTDTVPSVPAGSNWEYQPRLATCAAMCVTDVEREFWPASLDSRWGSTGAISEADRSRGVGHVVGVMLSEPSQDVNEPAASRIPGRLATFATYACHCGRAPRLPREWWSTSALRPDCVRSRWSWGH
jgi:hypothetical protein